MKVMLAGASVALGVPLIRELIGHGHEVLGLAHDEARGRLLAGLGASSVVADVMDRDNLLRAVDGLEFDAVIHESTTLGKAPTRHSDMAVVDRLRVAGTANLLAAAEATGARRFVSQSIVLGYGYRDHGTRPLSEADPFGQAVGDRCDPHAEAMRSAEEQAFTAPVGVALRFGMLYGGDAEQMRDMLTRRRIPVVAGGLLAWLHHEDAAAATVAALEHGRPGNAYNIVDDQPASWREVFTAMAAAYGAPPPRSLPAWLLRLVAPYVATFAAGTSMRVSNAKAKSELGWKPAFPSYREGVAAAAQM